MPSIGWSRHRRPPLNPSRDVRVASIFRNGRNQAIRLPRDMEFAGDQVLIEKHGDQLTVRPKPRDWAEYFATCGTFDADFPADIDDQTIGEEAFGW